MATARLPGRTAATAAGMGVSTSTARRILNRRRNLRQFPGIGPTAPRKRRDVSRPNPSIVRGGGND